MFGHVHDVCIFCFNSNSNGRYILRLQDQTYDISQQRSKFFIGFQVDVDSMAPLSNNIPRDFFYQMNAVMNQYQFENLLKTRISARMGANFFKILTRVSAEPCLED